MTAHSRNWWPVLFVLGVAFILLNVAELVSLYGGSPQIVGVVTGFVLIAVGITRQRGWEGVRR